MACLSRDIDNAHSVTVVFDLQGPCGGEELLQSIGDTFNIPRRTRDNPGGKLIYLVDPLTREVAAGRSTKPLPWSLSTTWTFSKSTPKRYEDREYPEIAVNVWN